MEGCGSAVYLDMAAHYSRILDWAHIYKVHRKNPWDCQCNGLRPKYCRYWSRAVMTWILYRVGEFFLGFWVLRAGKFASNLDYHLGDVTSCRGVEWVIVQS